MYLLLKSRNNLDIFEFHYVRYSVDLLGNCSLNSFDVPLEMGNVILCQILLDLLGFNVIYLTNNVIMSVKTRENSLGYLVLTFMMVCRLKCR